jgi:hypothetical protein
MLVTLTALPIWVRNNYNPSEPLAISNIMVVFRARKHSPPPEHIGT